MSTGRRVRISRRLAAGLVTGALASGWLLAQVVENKPVAGNQEPGATTEPAEPPATQPAQPTSAARDQLASGLIGSKHDFTRIGKAGRDLCLPCHTPHQFNVPPPRLDHRPTTTAPLRPYETLGVELTGWSLLCLGCHDGSTAPDVYSSPHAINVAGELGDVRLGTRGLRSHPVGVRYPPPGENYSAAPAIEASGLLLDDGRIQCTTCHDAHNTLRHAHMLRISNEGSRLCLTCHRI
jgi:predicted CXXCH cytochrome family protein